MQVPEMRSGELGELMRQTHGSLEGPGVKVASQTRQQRAKEVCREGRKPALPENAW